MLTLNNSSDLAQILNFILDLVLIAIGLGGAGAIGYNRARKTFIKKKESRLFANIQRPVALLPTKTDELELESRLLKAIEFFKVDLMPVDVRSLDEVTANYRLAIIRYENSKEFWRRFKALADKQMPLVIYSKPAEIPVPELQKIQKYYTRYTLCNTPVRLASDVFAIMSVYPEAV